MYRFPTTTASAGRKIKHTFRKGTHPIILKTCAETRSINADGLDVCALFYAVEIRSNLTKKYTFFFYSSKKKNTRDKNEKRY